MKLSGLPSLTVLSYMSIPTESSGGLSDPGLEFC